MGARLRLQAVFLAPHGQLPLVRGTVTRPGAILEIFLDRGLPVRIILRGLNHLFGAFPFPPVGDQTQQPSGQRVLRVVQDRERQVLDPLGRKAVRLAPECQSDWALGSRPTSAAADLYALRSDGPVRVPSPPTAPKIIAPESRIEEIIAR